MLASPALALRACPARRLRRPLGRRKAADIVERAIDGFVRPGLRELCTSDGRRSTQGDARRFATAPSQQTLDAARPAFGDTVDGLVGDRVHPLRPDHRGQPAGAHAVLAGPQEHRPEAGAGGARRQGPERDRSPTACRARASPCRGSARWNSCSTAPARKRLPSADGAYRCAYGAAIAGNHRDHRRRTSATAWDEPDGFAALWANPGPDNPLYRDGTEAVTELMDVFVTGLELVRDVRARRLPRRDAASRQAQAGAVLALAARPPTRLPAISPAWRRCSTPRSLATRCAEDKRWIAQSIAVRVRQRVASGQIAATGPIDEALADPARRDKLELSRPRHLQPVRPFRHQPVRRARPDRRLLLARRRLTMTRADRPPRFPQGRGRWLSSRALAPAALAATLDRRRRLRHRLPAAATAPMASAILSEAGKVLHAVDLPDRGHDITFDPVVAAARSSSRASPAPSPSSSIRGPRRAADHRRASPAGISSAMACSRRTARCSTPPRTISITPPAWSASTTRATNSAASASSRPMASARMNCCCSATAARSRSPMAASRPIRISAAPSSTSRP